MKRLLLCMVCACGDGGGQTPVDTAPADDAPADSGVCMPSTAPATKVYLNRIGGTYTNGAPETIDSSSNITNIVPAGSPKVLGVPTVVEADWTAMRTCLDGLFAPFNIELTEIDPAAAEHQEVVVVDSMSQVDPNLSSTSSVSSVLACDAMNKSVPIKKGITFVAWGQFGNTPQANRLRCEGIAQAIAVTYGLDHAFSCPDVLSFLTTCGAKSITDADVPCGESEARTCHCGGPTQNSYRYLADLVGETCQ